jgi:hypothetical protein
MAGSNPLRRVELERHKWDTHARASENRLANGSRRPQLPRPASAGRSASGIHGHAKRVLLPVTTPADASGHDGAAACLSSDSSYGFTPENAAPHRELTRAQAELYSALFGGLPRPLVSPISSSSSSPPAAAWEATYDLVDALYSPARPGHTSNGRTGGGPSPAKEDSYGRPAPFPAWDAERGPARDAGRGAARGIDGGPARNADGGPARDTDGGPAPRPSQAKLVERAVLRALRGASLQRQQAVDEAVAKVESRQDEVVRAAVDAAVQEVRAPCPKNLYSSFH